MGEVIDGAIAPPALGRPPLKPTPATLAIYGDVYARGVLGPGATWIDGRLVEADEARVSAFDHGLLTGDGVFETLRVYRGVPFAARRHLDRLGRSAAGMGLDLPAATALRSAMDEVVLAHGLVDGGLRITVTGGPAPLGSERGASTPTVIVAGGPMAPWP